MIPTLKENVLKIAKEKDICKKLPEDAYSKMKYPKVLPMMHFAVDQYELEHFGHLMVMHTTTKMGMELLTLSFCPQRGLLMPYLLVDAMSMKKKKCVFVEFYGCGQEDLNDEPLYMYHERLDNLEDYQEKPAWYIAERKPYSLIKTGEETELRIMAEAGVASYLELAKGAVESPEYLKKLAAFRERMITEGNPASKTLEMLLKKDGAEKFMREVVMPLDV